MPTDRSAIMRAVKSRDTKPELMLRSALHRAGLRFRLHRADLPGKPDLVFPAAKVAVFVHGCFWHGHSCPRGSRLPRMNRDYWTAKIAGNKMRDANTVTRLEQYGWLSLTIWECELGNIHPIVSSLKEIIRKQ